jgi:hypothetical protein
MNKTRLALSALAFAFACTLHSAAQAPAGAPAGTTGVCNDGSYYSGATKSGACRGHKGVKTWYGPTTTAAAPAAKPAAAPAPAPAAAPAPKAVAAAPAAAPAPAPAVATRTMPTPAAAAAPGGGPGMVWVNTASKVYHCPTDRYYGKTKAGKYLSESAAQAEGDKPDAGKKCF